MGLRLNQVERGSRAKRQFEHRVGIAGMQPRVFGQAHQPDRHQQTVAADFGNEVQVGINSQSQQLEGAPLWQVLLELSCRCYDFLRCAGVAQHVQQHADGL